MALSKVGFNTSYLTNISTPEFNIGNTTTEIITSIPERANNYTNGLLGNVILISLFSYLYLKISGTGSFSGLEYSTIRSLSIASGISGMVGMVMVNIGYYHAIYITIVFLTLFMLFWIWAFKEERD